MASEKQSQSPRAIRSSRSSCQNSVGLTFLATLPVSVVVCASALIQRSEMLDASAAYLTIAVFHSLAGPTLFVYCALAIDMRSPRLLKAASAILGLLVSACGATSKDHIAVAAFVANICIWAAISLLPIVALLRRLCTSAGGSIRISIAFLIYVTALSGVTLGLTSNRQAIWHALSMVSSSAFEVPAFPVGVCVCAAMLYSGRSKSEDRAWLVLLALAGTFAVLTYSPSIVWIAALTWIGVACLYCNNNSLYHSSTVRKEMSKPAT